MSASTPGPWVFVHDEPYEMSIRANGEKVPGLDIWLDDACFDLNHVRIANAKLAATAPALADALLPFVDAEPEESWECHSGICPMSECWRCKRIFAARTVLRLAGRLP